MWAELKIITVNLPVSYLKAIESLTGQEGLYPSRSELIRVAVRSFLIRELDAAKSFEKYQQSFQRQKAPEPVIDDNLYIQVPVGESLEGVKEYKTYKKVSK